MQYSSIFNKVYTAAVGYVNSSLFFVFFFVFFIFSIFDLPLPCNLSSAVVILDIIFPTMLDSDFCFKSLERAPRKKIQQQSISHY